MEKDVRELGTVEIQRVRQLETENRKLKQLAGDQALAIQVLNEFITKRSFDFPCRRDCENAHRKAFIRKKGLWHSANPPVHATIYPLGGPRQRNHSGRDTPAGQTASTVWDAPHDLAVSKTGFWGKSQAGGAAVCRRRVQLPQK